MSKKKVLCGGVFNIIHPGHRYFLERARKLGDELVVVVAHDSTVTAAGKRLLFPSGVRMELVGSLRSVDRAVAGSEKDMAEVVRNERPDVIAVGYDQDADWAKGIASEAGCACSVVRIGELPGYSTSAITGG